MTVPGYIDSLLKQLALPDIECLCVCSITGLRRKHIPPFAVDTPALITGLRNADDFAAAHTVLSAIYPPTHDVTVLSASAGSAFRHPISALASLAPQPSESALYVSPLPSGSSLEALQEVVAHLRAPEGCPWDRKQTHQSLRPHLLEEAYEAMQAMDSGDAAAMREEFGDLLLQIMLNAQIAAEAGEFTVNDVARAIHDKLIRRHPHVFAEVDIQDVDGVLSNWERLKESERAEKGQSAGLLEGVPVALPALSQAQEYQDRAARVGFDWPEITGVLDKIAEEVREVVDAKDAASLETELGDLLFSLVNFTRWKGVDAESALRAANQRFRHRFQFIEAAAERRGRRLSELSLQEMDAFWDEAKSHRARGTTGT